MKTILGALAILAITGCVQPREIQVELIPAQLVKIDTVFRQPNEQKQILTWRDRDNVEYISYANMDQNYPLGISLLVMRAR